MTEETKASAPDDVPIAPAKKDIVPIATPVEPASRVGADAAADGNAG